ncbi:MAG: hypothetical protein H0X62_01030 [Bacteroidetes bacterium]|nr:hypothetical protein [Bacteroidota bacterium]
MKRLLINILFLLFSMQLFGHIIRLDKINPPFKNKFNPFLEVLHLNTNKISTIKGSSRIILNDGGYIDLFYKDKKLWNLSRHDKNGNALDVGDFKNGDGTLRINTKEFDCQAQFINGMLDGSAIFYFRHLKGEKPRSIYKFKEGLLDGESIIYSFIDFNVISSKEHYQNGYLQLREQYGRRKIRPGIFGIKVKIVEPDKICSKTIYNDGKLVSHECYVKKCRNCGY